MAGVGWDCLKWLDWGGIEVFRFLEWPVTQVPERPLPWLTWSIEAFFPYLGRSSLGPTDDD